MIRRTGRPVLLALALAACAREAPRAPAGPPRRIVSLLPAYTAWVVALGAGDRLVGCTEYGEPGREVTRVPWQGPDAAEAIVRCRPDLVLRQTPRREKDVLASVLERANIPVLSLPSETMADARAAIPALAAALGLEERGAALARDFDARMDAVRAKAAGGSRPKVLFVFGRDAGLAANISAAGPGSFLDEMIRAAGGRNALEDLARPYPAIGLDDFVRAAPDVIIDNLPPEDDPHAAWARFAEVVPAVRDGRVYAIRDRGLLIPGPRLPEAVERLAEMIHG